MLLSFVVVYFADLLTLRAHFDRYLLPLIPVLGVLAVIAVVVIVAVVLALRSTWTHNGGTWAVPGGALNHGETALEGALREFAEEIGHHLDGYEVAHTHEDDHGGWTYTTVVVDVPERFDPPGVLQWETAECRWAHASELHELELFGAFRATLERLGLLGA